MIIDSEEFNKRAGEQFPEDAAYFKGQSVFVTMSEVSSRTNDAIRASDWVTVRDIFDFIDEIFTNADKLVRNAIYVSFLEHTLLDRTEAEFLKARTMLSPQLENALQELEAHFDSLKPYF